MNKARLSCAVYACFVILSAYSLNTNATTIDQMTIWSTSYPNANVFDPQGSSYYQKLLVFGSAYSYQMSDGTTWYSGAGLHPVLKSTVQSVSQQGSVISYTFIPPANGFLFDNLDRDNGLDSAKGTLGIVGPLTITATAGGTIAQMTGVTRIISNDPSVPAGYAPLDNFHYYSANLGDLVQFSMTYTLLDSTWTADIFQHRFTYEIDGVVDFTTVVPTPAAIWLFSSGLLGLIGIARRKRLN